MKEPEAVAKHGTGMWKGKERERERERENGEFCTYVLHDNLHDSQGEH